MKAAMILFVSGLAGTTVGVQYFQEGEWKRIEEERIHIAERSRNNIQRMRLLNSIAEGFIRQTTSRTREQVIEDLLKIVESNPHTPAQLRARVQGTSSNNVSAFSNRELVEAFLEMKRAELEAH